MKKIKALHYFIIAIIIIYCINFIMGIFWTISPPDFLNFGEKHYEQFILGYYTQFVGSIFSFITFIGLFFLKQSLYLIIKKGFFNDKSSIKLTIAGRLILISGLLSLIWDFVLLIYSNGEIVFISIILSDVLQILIGFGLLIIVDFITNGNVLQQENNLTI